MEFDFLKATLLEQSILLSSCYGIIDGRHDYEVAAEIMQQLAHRFGGEVIISTRIGGGDDVAG